MSLYINDKITGKINSISGQQRIDKELDINSENPVENKVISSKLEELDTELINIKKSVSDGKSKVASAITEKGVSTEATDTFDVMAENIGQIESGTKNTITIYSKGIISNANPSNIVIAEKILKTPYLLGNGMGYFTTGLKFGDATKVEIKFKVTALTNDWHWIFMTRESLSEDGKMVGVASYQNNELRLVNATAYANNLRISVDTSTVYHMIFDNINKKLNVVNEGLIYNLNEVDASVMTNMSILASHAYDGVTYQEACDNSIRLYGFKVYENNVIIRDYIPSKDSDGIVCLYDKVNDEYLYDATGTNTFEYGEEYRI